jgi:hypothetical protein
MDAAALIDRLRPSGFGKPTAHFLHIGKTGGTAVKEGLGTFRTRGDYRIVVQPHHVTLADLPTADAFFFLLRHPVTRFASGFTSRQRQGAPRYANPWTPQEKVAFERFPTSNALAEALGSQDAEEREAAGEAMRTIGHVRASYWRWFVDEETLRARSDRLIFCGAMESLSDDFPRLLAELGLQGRGLDLPTDDVKAHRTPTSSRSPLSPAAVANLQQWYARDFELIALCDELHASFHASDCLGEDTPSWPRRPGS